MRSRPPFALALSLLALLTFWRPAAGGPADAVGEAPVEVPAGTPVREVASPVGRLLWRVEAAVALPVLDRSGDWVRVADGERSGWVELVGVAAAEGEAAKPAATEDGAEETPAASEEPERPGPQADGGDGAAPPPTRGGLFDAAGPAAAHLLAGAHQALGEARELRWGRFAVVTDLADHPLVLLGEPIAAGLPELHARRYGFAAPRAAGGPSPSAAGPGSALLLPADLGTVVLFAREDDYRAFVAATAGGSPAADLAGHAAGGVAALPVAGRTARQAAPTLIHELAHLLNRRRWGDDLPPWLDEGVAGDLELVEIGDAGDLDASRWAAGPPDREGRRGRTGPLLALDRLLADAHRGRLETVAELVAFDRSAFAASPRSLERYALAALWVRHLLDEPTRAAAFRRFLAALAVSPTPTDGGAALLAEALATDLAALDRPFHLWLRDLARRH